MDAARTGDGSPPVNCSKTLGEYLSSGQKSRSPVVMDFEDRLRHGRFGDDQAPLNSMRGGSGLNPCPWRFQSALLMNAAHRSPDGEGNIPFRLPGVA